MMTFPILRAANAAPQLPKLADLLVTTTGRPSQHRPAYDHQAGVATGAMQAERVLQGTGDAASDSLLTPRAGVPVTSITGRPSGYRLVGRGSRNDHQAGIQTGDGPIHVFSGCQPPRKDHAYTPSTIRTLREARRDRETGGMAPTSRRVTSTIAAPTAAALMTQRKGYREMNTLRLSSRARNAVEDLADLARGIHADGVVDTDELTRFRTQLDTAAHLTAYTDDTLGLGLTMIRGGETERYEEKRRDVERLYDTKIVSLAQYRRKTRIQKRRHHGNDDSAA